ncbi:MAG: hypothetical protein GYB65_05380, partial [Chloroflexi bacterium]|nr:hypothetical protein [Chloroflexota bacterium]
FMAVRALDSVHAIQGMSSVPYLATWAAAMVWNTSDSEYPTLGLLALGGLFVVTLVITAVIDLLTGGRGGHPLYVRTGVIASVNALVGWGILSLVADDFALAADLVAQGAASLIVSLAVLVMFLATALLREQIGRYTLATRNTLVLAGIGLVWTLVVIGLVTCILATWPAIFVALVTLLLLVTDLTGLTDCALFGLALGATAATRVNMAPLAGIIVLAAFVRSLPLFDPGLSRSQRGRIVAYGITGVVVAALVSIFVFRVLHPHALKGPGFFSFERNPGWWEDLQTAAEQTSGSWDAPPNHQWADRPPYLFPWRNIVLWGLGIPLGLVGWIGWGVAGIGILRARRYWTRHLLPFMWVLVIFGWIGGRWVTTMRYFLPIYPALVLFGAWALWTLVEKTWALVRERRAYTRRPAFAGRAVTWSRLAFAGTVALLIAVSVYTALFGYGMHRIHSQQLTRVAASRWFQEYVPGDFGVWVEGTDGNRHLVNVGVSAAQDHTAPDVVQYQQGHVENYPLTVTEDAYLTRIAFNRLSDPARDANSEQIRVRIVRSDQGMTVYEGVLRGDFAVDESTYGTQYILEPDQPIFLQGIDWEALGQVDPADPNLVPNVDPGVSGLDAIPSYYSLQFQVERGPVTLVGNVVDEAGTASTHITVTYQRVESGINWLEDVALDSQPFVRGSSDEVPSVPTLWPVGSLTEVKAFTVPIEGEIRQIDIPHLGDVLRDDDAETVRFLLMAPTGEQRSVTITDDLQAGADSLGPPRTLIFDPPLPVLPGDPIKNTYRLYMESPDPIYTSGPVIAWEGDWDDPVPTSVCPIDDDEYYRDDLPSGLATYDCAAIGMFPSFYQGLKLWMVWEDVDDKYDAMLLTLDQADYVVITSNRFYDSLSRMPMRWPMTLAYYEALFDGRLGFDLVRTFTSYPSVGPISIPDQILPTDDFPDWMNERWVEFLNDHWEAEEAYTVYDHPAVLVFRKNENYSSENTQAILNSVSRRRAETANLGYVVDPEPVSILTWGAEQVSESPTLLQFDDEKWNIQRDNGTWSGLFDTDSLINRNHVAAVFIWWLLMVVVGWLTWPLLFALFPALPDRAFPVAKLAGWLIVAWIAWVGGTLNILTWTRPGLLLILLGLAALSAAMVWRRRADFWDYIRANRRHLLLIEGLTLLLFLFFVGVRLGNPDMWHSPFGGERPMDFAYFNAVVRSTVFPPLDPWFSGGYLNYYYFGYVIVGAPVKLLGVQPSIAYNLILPMLFAMTGIGVFSIAYNWVRARRTEPGVIVGATRDEPRIVTPLLAGDADHVDFDENAADIEGILADEDTEDDGDDLPLPTGEARSPRGSAWLAGVAALVLAMVLGNLGVLHVFVTEVAKMDGWNAEPPLTTIRRAELNAEYTEIRQEISEQELQRFRDHTGQEPQTPEQQILLQVRIDEETTDAIYDESRAIAATEQLQHSFGNFRELVGSFFGGLDEMLDGQPFPENGSHRWHWAPTRIISELPGGAGNNAINEMPYFTFLYGDMHAHMIAMPVTLLVLLWLLAEIIGAGQGLRNRWEATLALCLGAMAVGVLRPTNSWDWITYLILGAAGMVYVTWLEATRTTYNQQQAAIADEFLGWLAPRFAWRWILGAFVVMVGAGFVRVSLYFLQRRAAIEQSQTGLLHGEELIEPSLSVPSMLLWVFGALALVLLVYAGVVIALKAGVNRRIVVNLLLRVAGFVILTFIAAWPFTAYFATQYDQVKLSEFERTPLWAYLLIHGVFLFIVFSLLLWLTVRWLRGLRVRQLEGRLVTVGGVGLIVLSGLFVSLVMGVRDVPHLLVSGPLMAWAALLFFLPRQSPLLRPVYALVVLALAITLGVDIVVLAGDIGRQNTVFKFYIQVWFLFSIVSGIGLAWMLRTSWRWNGPVRAVWQTGLAILLTIALLYPVLATQARWLDRFNADETPLTLDGMEYMKYSVHGENGVWFSLESDYHLIRWMQENIEGTPVIMEAHLYSPLYRWSGRVSVNTGLPTLLGWDWHQTQQRTLPNMNALIHTRQNNTAAFYQLAGAYGIETAQNLIEEYDIEYIVLGIMERVTYDDILPGEEGILTPGHAQGLEKFDDMVELGLLEVVYERAVCVLNNVDRIEDCPEQSVYQDKIYRVVPGAEWSASPVAAR